MHPGAFGLEVENSLLQISTRVTIESRRDLVPRHLSLGPATQIGRKANRVVLHGLRFFCQKLSALVADERWDIRDRSVHTPVQVARLLRDLPACDLVFNWGGRIDMGRFLWAARSLRAPKVVFFWCGSDVLRAQKILAKKTVEPWIARQTHWAASPTLAQEVRALGLRCEYVQASFVEVVQHPKPLPREFSVLVFLPRADLAELYGWDHIMEVAKGLPDVRFTLIGLHPGQHVETPSNMRVHPRTSDMAPVYQEATVLWRPVRHDAGISFMVLEALSHGRHVVYTSPIAGAVQLADAEAAKRHFEYLRKLHDAGNLPLNFAGIQAVARTYSRDVVRRELHNHWDEIIRS